MRVSLGDSRASERNDACNFRNEMASAQARSTHIAQSALFAWTYEVAGYGIADNFASLFLRSVARVRCEIPNVSSEGYSTDEQSRQYDNHS